MTMVYVILTLFGIVLAANTLKIKSQGKTIKTLKSELKIAQNQIVELTNMVKSQEGIINFMLGKNSNLQHIVEKTEHLRRVK